MPVGCQHRFVQKYQTPAKALITSYLIVNAPPPAHSPQLILTEFDSVRWNGTAKSTTSILTQLL